MNSAANKNLLYIFRYMRMYICIYFWEWGNVYVPKGRIAGAEL